MKPKTMILDGCPLCGHQMSLKKYAVTDFSTSQEVFDIVECRNCFLLFTNPRPKSSDIAKYYNSSSYISHTNQQTGLFAKAYQMLRKSAIIKKEKWISGHVQKGSILDYGCGTGEFLNYCKTKGREVRGIEIANAPRAQAKDNYNLMVLSPNEIDDFEENQFDVVTMWHVLEHIDDLHGTLAKLISKLKTNGVLVVAVPNPDSWDAKHYKEFWAAWDVPIHFYHFKKENVIYLAINYGLELVEIKNMPYDAYYISLLSEQYKNGKKNWLKAILYGAVSNLKAGKANASSLTYIFKKL